MPAGALLRALHERQRTLLLRLAREIAPIAGVTAQVAAVVAGAIVGVDGDGLPFYDTTLAEGYAVHEDAGTGELYIDTAEAPINLDPFGENGGTPGFPLPADTVAVTTAVAVLDSGATLPIGVQDETQRAEGVGSRSLRAFVSHNRLVPLRSGAAPYSDAWNSVASVQASYLACPTLAALTDTLDVPEAFLAPLTAWLAEFLASASKGCSEADKRRFERARQEADAELEAAAGTLVGDLTATEVVYRRR